MLLSIVMMIKNEERYLDKTLNALVPLINEIDSELIILDTGSTDSSIEIAKKYTDKVYFEKWNNDFGQMRNKAISYANGEWILILDADEELTNYEKLKEFFNSKMYLKYNSATIMLKNIFSQDKTSYNISPMIRLFKNDEEFGYKGAIHEQPIFKRPIFNGLAEFNHYGYLFEDEEVRQLKDDRNKKILLKEIEEKPNDPYMNYQLGKQYIISNDYEDAIYYMEKGYKIYESIGYIPIFVTLDLASLYIDLKEFNKCEKLCLRYIKKDNKNIDIYYYIALSQKNLNKYKQSIENYNRYLYLIENYDITTQANEPECNSDTLIHKDKCKVNILDIYYKLEMYDEIVKDIDELSDYTIEESYLVIFMSLYKLNKEAKLIDIYNKISTSIVQKNKFKIAIEVILKRIKEKDKEKIYRLLSNIDGNYGILNKIRVGNVLEENQYNEILINERESYYGDIVYYALKQGIDIERLLDGVDYISIQNYISYIVNNRRDCILNLFDYLEYVPNTLNIKKIQLYSCISKTLLTNGGLTKDKHKILFHMYIRYTYENLKLTYNQKLDDEEIINLLRLEEDQFVFNINKINAIRNIEPLAYIRALKNSIIKHQTHKKSIQFLIDEFERELNESTELKELKSKYKSIIESSIGSGNLKDAITMIDEYESIFKSEDEAILNMKAIIAIMNNEFKDAENLLKKSWLLNDNNFNTIFNIAYLKEILGDIEEAISFYGLIVNRCKNDEIVADAKEKINKYKSN
ncbi:glycosyltransferase [Paraclostridium bifermentans]|uniref:glycosyltransferase n=1 Tax=Paraclostridium bifermentans TaxID=1490 RepID=UPI00359C3141